MNRVLAPSHSSSEKAMDDLRKEMEAARADMKEIGRKIDALPGSMMIPVAFVMPIVTGLILVASLLILGRI